MAQSIEDPQHPAGAHPGLCGVCRHARVVRTSRGSTFHLCERSTLDVRYKRYPALPVLECVGFERRKPPVA